MLTPKKEHNYNTIVATKVQKSNNPQQLSLSREIKSKNDSYIIIISSYSYNSISQLSSQKNNIPHSIQVQRNYSQLCFSKSSSNGISNLKMSNTKVNQSNTNTIISITANTPALIDALNNLLLFIVHILLSGKYL